MCGQPSSSFADPERVDPDLTFCWCGFRIEFYCTVVYKTVKFEHLKWPFLEIKFTNFPGNLYPFFLK